MSEEYAREILRRNVAQICQTIGWNGINSTPLDILVHVLEKYISTLGTQANRYAEQFNRTEPNLHDLGLVFRDLHVQLPELAEYTRSVPPVPPPVSIEKFPKPKESNLNFLKPGSHEVVTRPVHVHEHLPPMYPDKERDTPVVADTVEIRQNGIDVEGTTTSCASPEISVTDSPEKPKEIFKRPTDPVSLPNSKKPRLRLDEEERTREISSVMMTMSGFLSPAREGKLPEARPPTNISEKHFDRHRPNSQASPLNPALLEKSDKKSKKNKILNGKVMKSKRKEKSHKGESSKSKDSSRPGHAMKSKDIHHNHVTMPAPKGAPPPVRPVMPPPVIPPPIMEPMRPIKQEPIDPPMRPMSPSPRPISTEDSIPVPRKIPISKSPLVSNTSVRHPNPSSIHTPDAKKHINEDEKLATQPEKSKLNIFKKISNKSKEDKTPDSAGKSQSDGILSRLQNVRVKTEDSVVNNNDNSAVDLSKDIDLTANEDLDESIDMVDDFKAVNSKPHSWNMEEKLKAANSKIPTMKQTQNDDFKPLNSKHSFKGVNEDFTDFRNKIPKQEIIDDEYGDYNSKPSFKPAGMNQEMNKSRQGNQGDEFGAMNSKPATAEPRPSISINKSLQLPYPKEVSSVSPKIKKEKKHKDKKDKLDKTAKIEAKLLKKQQQQLAFEMAQADKQNLKLNSPKTSKSGRPKNKSELPQMPPGFPFFPAMTPGRGLMPGPGLIPNPGLIPGGDFLAGLTNNPALRGLPNSNLITNPFALLGPNWPGPGLRPGMNPLIPPIGNYPHSSRSSSSKIPPMLRRPSLEVIPVDNDDDRGSYKSPTMPREKDRHDKHKSPTIPNILQKHKSKSHKEHKSMFKMPPVQPDITIELNPPKAMEPVKQDPPPRARSPSPEPLPPTRSEPEPEVIAVPETSTPDTSEKDIEKSEKKKDKSHKKEKKDKDGIKIKKKKDKKDKNKDKSEKKRDKEERQELKDRIKKEKKEKKKEKSADGIVPKLTLKLGSSNSNSPMPPSSPDVFKLNIKPVVKKEEEESSPFKEEPVSREHSRSPELAQISALVTRPPKQKHTKHNHVSETDGVSSPPPSGSSPPRKNRPPSSHSKYKRLLFKPMSKKGHSEHFEDDDIATVSEEPPAPAPEPQPQPADKPTGPLPTPYYVDVHGNKIWVCPACGRPDNGSPMIGCDGCDGWYHWVCVGITEEPGATEDWFCSACLAKRAAMLLAGVPGSKKRGRKPKGEKIRDCH